MKTFVNNKKKEIEIITYILSSFLIFSNILSIDFSITNQSTSNQIYFFDITKILSIFGLLTLFIIFFFSFPLKINLKYIVLFLIIIIIFFMREGLSPNLSNFRTELVLFFLIFFSYFLNNFNWNKKFFFYFIIFNNLLLIILNFPYFIEKLSFFTFLPIEHYSGHIDILYQNHPIYSLIEPYNSTYILFFCFYILNFYALKMIKNFYILKSFKFNFKVIYFINIINFLIIFYCGPIYLKFTILIFSIFYFIPLKLFENYFKLIFISLFISVIFFSFSITKLNFHNLIYKSLYYIEFGNLSKNKNEFRKNNICKNNVEIYQFVKANLNEDYCLEKFQYPFLSLTKRFKMQDSYNEEYFSNFKSILFGLEQNYLNNLSQNKNFPHNSLIDVLSKYGIIIFLILLGSFIKLLLNKKLSKFYFLTLLSLTILIFFDDYLIGNKIATSFFLWMIVLNPFRNYEV